LETFSIKGVFCPTKEKIARRMFKNLPEQSEGNERGKARDEALTKFPDEALELGPLDSWRVALSLQDI
jgi:hypothetical protein